MPSGDAIPYEELEALAADDPAVWAFLARLADAGYTIRPAWSPPVFANALERAVWFADRERDLARARSLAS